MVFVDTSVLMYAVGRDHPLRPRARRFFAAATTDQQPLATSSEVLQELAHAYLPVERTRALAAALQLIERTRTEVWPLERDDVILGIELASRHPAPATCATSPAVSAAASPAYRHSTAP